MNDLGKGDASSFTMAGCPGARGRTTGFFHVEKINGIYWLINPQGLGFFVVGTDHISFEGQNCEKLGYSPYHANNLVKHGRIEHWADSTISRLKSWGFNTLAWGHSEILRHRGFPHIIHMEMGTEFARRENISPPESWTGFPDVFSPDFSNHCESTAEECCSSNGDDPCLMGYFIDNELEWFGRSRKEEGLVLEVLRKTPDHPARVQLTNFLRSRYDKVEALNRAWGTDFNCFDDLGPQKSVQKTARFREDADSFLEIIAERYFSVTTSAIRKYDKNHLVLGCRFGSDAPDTVWRGAGRHCDVISVNCYRTLDLEREVITDGFEDQMSRWYRLSEKPLMITEWSFPALDAGLPCTHGAGQRVPTQRHRAKAFRIFQETLFSTPFLVGSNYFMWVDEPELGISSDFPEDSNYGLVNEQDEPYPELTAAASDLNPKACEIHLESGLNNPLQKYGFQPDN